MYAHTREGGVLKLWRSVDGVNWTSIAPANFPTSSGRVVIAIAPSDENIVYFFVQGPNNTPATAGHQLWRYSHSTGTWENRAINLPSDLSTQSGYDMTLHIKPDNHDFVLIGGTNLYRSTDGFTTSNYSTIGGYPYYNQAGDTHHPDLQGGMFKPTNPNIYYSTTDGGIHRANNILMPEPMAWESLNNGYNVTQLYSVAISPDSGDNMIVAGAQDNGSLATDSSDTWYEIYGGDGTVLELAPIADDRRYTQYQNGPIQRQTRTGQGVATITPSGSTRQLFVNPIALDPNNSKIMYYGAGKSSSPTITSGIWRNDNAPNASTAGWVPIYQSDVGSVSGWTRRVSAIGVSKYNSANVVYIGTTDGIIKRIDNANGTSPTGTDITPPGLNGGTAQGGFVRCIAVNHYNSNYALAAFGNYNFRNLWLTTDGGTTWTDVEGNLSGPDGPSVRWATYVPNGNDINVFIGTSIGLLMTERLRGDSTVWVHAAANAIGNVLIGYMDYRESDRLLVVGTHGRGVFSAKVPGTPTSVKETNNVPTGYALEQNYPNPFNPSTKIRYQVPENRGQGTEIRVTLKVYDVMGREVATLVNEEKAPGSYEVEFDAARDAVSPMASGVYYYRLKTGDKFVTTKKMVLLK
ncbi:MAG: T9SS type A sorting domain-containing protein [Ignavibacteriaceae bacterium]|nr:T9SS type A sorting domain-containing protein [Ignavibacteriaceae bacterium]